MEKVLMTKANYLADTLGHNVHIIRVQQHGKNNFFNFSKNIIFHDLDINYDEDDNKNIIWRMICRKRKKKIHKKKLEELLQKLNVDICISMFDYEFDILPYIKDKSRKLLEYHFCKQQKVNEQRNPIMKILQRIRVSLWTDTIKKYDSFVVLTEEDKGNWGSLDNICVIPNPLVHIPTIYSDVKSKNIVAIGRLTYSKGFDRLIDAWAIIANKYSDWKLVIYGDGEEKEYLNQQIINKGIEKNTFMQPATKDIDNVYKNASMLIMTSRNEGLPMVMLEALSYGIPVVTFDFPCGPKDIIANTDMGSIIRNGDINALAKEIEMWINSYTKRVNANNKAVIFVRKFELTSIMGIWEKYFHELTNKEVR
ncbi:glycosyltransferase family 4 protein [Bacteroides caecigallinarum]|uniref:glycosyltransferase family 4 protein n=1 Tax=Bacteroides caecigallinarum TaxID=1411144 RepID=UPI001956EB05|nr:glycosyltransferase family 4 protein [Bacteroides caecigallinarum]MBM6866529.1 glycosyltransferase family 4 protein [Bacteroides caecigallinarum]